MIMRRDHREKEVRRRPGVVNEERRADRDGVEQAIDEIAEEYHDCCPQHEAKGIEAIYARYSTRFQVIIADQVQASYDWVVKHGIHVPRDHVFFDVAMRGCEALTPGTRRRTRRTSPRDRTRTPGS